MGKDFELPPAPMPDFLLKSVNKLPITPADLSPEEQEPLDPALVDFWNPWHVHKVEGHVPYTDEAREEEKLHEVHAAVRKLFFPEEFAAAPAATPVRFEKQSDPAAAQELTKRVAASTRKASLTDYIRRQLAIGETIEGLAEFAEQHDQETANLIREIGNSL
jgi:hypothetical protein